MDKNLSVLVDRLKRIFPHLKMYNEGHYFTDDSSQNSGKQSRSEKAKGFEEDFAPPVDLDWFAIIEELEKNGLTIVNKKDVVVEDATMNVARAMLRKDIMKRVEPMIEEILKPVEPVVIDLKLHNRQKLRDAVLKKHRREK